MLGHRSLEVGALREDERVQHLPDRVDVGNNYNACNIFYNIGAGGQKKMSMIKLLSMRHGSKCVTWFTYKRSQKNEENEEDFVHSSFRCNKE